MSEWDGRGEKREPRECVSVGPGGGGGDLD